jgi:hypothetical protein
MRSARLSKTHAYEMYVLRELYLTDVWLSQAYSSHKHAALTGYTSHRCAALTGVQLP